MNGLLYDNDDAWTVLGDMDTHSGNCHCGNVSFTVRNELNDPVICNCTFCQKRGSVLNKVLESEFVLVSGANCLSVYGNRDFSDHFFCSRCGVHVFTRSSRNGEDAVVVNLGCLENASIDDWMPRTFDGANLL